MGVLNCSSDSHPMHAKPALKRFLATATTYRCAVRLVVAFWFVLKQARNIALCIDEQNGSFLKQYLTQEYDSGLVGIVKVCRILLLTLLVSYVKFDLISEQ